MESNKVEKSPRGSTIYGREAKPSQAKTPLAILYVLFCSKFKYKIDF